MDAEIKKLTQPNLRTLVTDVSALSSRQRKRLDEFSSRARAALWFSRELGFNLDAICVQDVHDNRYTVQLKGNDDASPSTGTVDNPPNNGSESKYKHFERLSESEKEKVECLLFLLDKFGVSDIFVHEMAMTVDEMPRSYLIKECRAKLNSTCMVSPVPGSCPGAQVSFRQKLIERLTEMVGFNKFISIMHLHSMPHIIAIVSTLIIYALII